MTEKRKRDDSIHAEPEKLRSEIVALKQRVESLRKTQLKLKARLSLLEQVTDNMLDMVSMVDKDGKLLYCSRSHRTTLGYDPEKVLGMSIMEAVHPEDYPSVWNAFCGAVASRVHV